jgi:hypothetical protein
MDPTTYDAGNITQSNFNSKFLTELKEKKIFELVNLRDKVINIADYGCATGKNSVPFIHDLLSFIEEQQINLCMSDLETNDFRLCLNNINKAINDERFFINFTFRSFYERIYPDETFNFGMALSCLHWMSTKNWYKEDACMPQNSKNEEVVEKARVEAENDYVKFLKHRENEFKEGGILVINGPLNAGDNKIYFDYIWKAWENFLTKKDLLKIKKYFYLGFYFRNEEEIKKPMINKDVKFEIISMSYNKYYFAKNDSHTVISLFKPLLPYFLNHVFDDKLPEEYSDIKLTPEDKKALYDDFWEELKSVIDDYGDNFPLESDSGYNLVLRRIS